jgi:hypothetical protein
MNKKMIIVGFNNGSTLIFDLHLRTQLQELQPPIDCQIDNHYLNTNVNIDDQCTMLSYLSSNKREINILAFDWDYKCTKIEKGSFLNELLESRNVKPLVKAKIIEPEPEVEKKKTCVIF